MATKPKTTTDTTKGTKVHHILELILAADNFTFSSYKDAADHYNDKFGTDFSGKLVSKAVRFFNEGLYRVNGVTVDDGKIHLLELEELEELEELIVVEPSSGSMKKFKEACKELGISPTAAGGSYIKENGMTLRIPSGVAVGVSSEEESKNLQLARSLVENELKTTKSELKSKKVKTKNTKVGVLNIADIHLGAFVKGLQQTPDYCLQNIKDFFVEMSDQINSMDYKEVHVNFLGDMVETGAELMHAGQWKTIENGISSAVDAIKISVDVLHHYLLSRINNLKEINMISGNHDRLLADKSAGTEGEMTKLIVWGLEFLKYKVEYNALILSKEIDGINYILTHGDQRISKLSSEHLAYQWGNPKLYNLNLQGHLHSLAKFASQKPKNIETLKIDDNITNRLRKMILPSLFGGNDYSENGGWTSQQGYVIIENNGKGAPNVFDFAL
jgi:predicted phosphodiesterase